MSKNTVRCITKKQQEILENFFSDGTHSIEIEPACWITGLDYDQSEDYCCCCAERKIEELKRKNPKGQWEVDGAGGFNECDHTPFCETCEKRLKAILTDYGCACEVNYFMDNGFDVDSSDDRCSMDAVISHRGWERWKGHVYEREYERKDDIEYFGKLHKLCRIILKDLKKKELT